MGAVEGIRDSSVAGVRTSAVPMWVKLMTGKPKPEFVKPLPAMVKLAGGETRSIGLGVMELTPRVSLTVSEKIGRASWRERGERSVGAVSIKKKNNNMWDSPSHVYT